MTRRGTCIGIKWFRSNVRPGAKVALFALFVQFTLSFGHFHTLEAPWANATQSAQPRATVVDAGDSQAKKQQAAGRHDGDRRSPDGCAICAVIAMASMVPFSAPPILLLLEAVEFLYRTTGAEWVI